MSNQTIYSLIDELQEVVNKSPGKAFSKNKVIDVKLVNEIIEDIKAALEDEFAVSREISEQKDEYLNHGKSQAEDILRQAEDALKEAKIRSSAMLNENNLVKAAHERSAKMIESAKAQAKEVRASAITYADEVLMDLEDYFKEYMTIVQDNRSRLYAKPAKEGADQEGTQQQ